MGRVRSGVQLLPTMHKALGLISNTTHQSQLKKFQELKKSTQLYHRSANFTAKQWGKYCSAECLWTQAFGSTEAELGSEKQNPQAQVPEVNKGEAALPPRLTHFQTLVVSHCPQSFPYLHLSVVLHRLPSLACHLGFETMHTQACLPREAGSACWESVVGFFTIFSPSTLPLPHPSSIPLPLALGNRAYFIRCKQYNPHHWYIY